MHVDIVGAVGAFSKAGSGHMKYARTRYTDNKPNYAIACYSRIGPAAMRCHSIYFVSATVPTKFKQLAQCGGAVGIDCQKEQRYIIIQSRLAESATLVRKRDVGTRAADDEVARYECGLGAL